MTSGSGRGVWAVLGGQDVTLRLPQGGGARTAALLAGLCTPGVTLWLLPGEVPQPAEEPARAERPRGPRGSGATSTSVAREPSAADAQAMAQEASSEPEFRFVRTSQLGAVLEELGDRAGLLVVDIGVPVPSAPSAPSAPSVRTLVLRRPELSSG